MKDTKGIPDELSGFDLGSATQEQYQNRIVEVLQSRIKPRVQGISIRMLPLQNGKWAAIIRVPKSFAAPHQVEVGSKDFQFWFRHAAGKQRMDIDEIRSSIVASDSLAERIRGFRIDRLGRIVSDETPIPLLSGPKIVMHLIPLNAFDPSSRYDLSGLRTFLKLLEPIYAGLREGAYYNFDGILAHDKMIDEPQGGSYVQVFNNGTIESVEGRLFSYSGETTLDMFRVEELIIDALKRYITILTQLNINPPVLLLLSLLNINGYRVGAGNRYSFHNLHRVITEKNLLIPEEQIESFDQVSDQILRPIFDRIWNAAGWPRSIFYADDGSRIQRQ